MSEDVPQALARVRARVDAAAREAGRDPAEVAVLLAVKTVTAERVREAITAGYPLLGQNRAQELTAIEPDLVDLEHRTHFIGHLQSNKVNAVLRWVDCVQSVDTAALAERLDRARARLAEADSAQTPLEVMIQVNTSGEDSKYGIAPHEVLDLAAAVGALPWLRLTGFMTIGANSTDTGRVRASYQGLAEVRDQVLASDAVGTGEAHELSMGMSGDLEIAIAAGATMVRVGSAVFGSRPAPA
ncbi:YggS family pyridoxal phosphate-dependent enzyme [Pseudactinotalea suaedae]|uniref:YggS family pyridoxal phosphate-dependent enzyme n=1 Tax=Pseudactinotalea suaedae TaxID=1524924 RepID=UPI0012E159C5|nr:YggS family pyridoxal phosphate-dependent enzyme [Pseudactinotalea suaedae]